jgi:hypothetical protein
VIFLSTLQTTQGGHSHIFVAGAIFCSIAYVSTQLTASEPLTPSLYWRPGFCGVNWGMGGEGCWSTGGIRPTVSIHKRNSSNSSSNNSVAH